MNLEAQIKRDVESHEPMACYDLQGSLNVISFSSIAETNDDREPGYSVKNGIATINVHGLLVPKTTRDYSDWGVTAYNHLTSYIERAKTDPQVTKAVLDISSNGGYVQGLDDVTEAIEQFDKPIEAHASGHMYSAALNIGVTADTVTATKNSGVGSIGTLIVHYEESKALEMRGVKVTYIRSGKHKAAINSEEPLGEDQLEKLAGIVEEDAQAFYKHVSKHRKIDVKTIASWGGDTFSAQTAKDYGLIDKITKQATSLPTNPITSSEDTMDLQAKITQLESEKAQQASLIESEKARADKAEADAKAANEALAKTKTDARQTELTELGVEMTDDNKAVYMSMADDAFDLVVANLKAVKAKEPKVPEGLFNEQAVTGAEAQTNDLDGNINKWVGA